MRSQPPSRKKYHVTLTQEERTAKGRVGSAHQHSSSFSRWAQPTLQVIP